MALLFKDIYREAVHLFDDPTIQKAYAEDCVKWQKMMYPYLQNGIHRFTNPTKIAFALSDQASPYGQIDTMVGNGSKSYNVDSSFVPNENCDFSFKIGKEYDYGATYEDGIVTFSRPVQQGMKCSIEWYFGGQFNTDFSSCTSATCSKEQIEYQVRGILANALVLGWAENEQNFLLDIRNLLNDTDFKLYSNANSLKAKLDWTKQLLYNFDTQTTNLGWLLVSRKYHGGNYYG